MYYNSQERKQKANILNIQKILFSRLASFMFIYSFLLMEEAKKYVLGIEGSANKVGIGTSNPTKASLNSKEISYPILERPS